MKYVTYEARLLRTKIHVINDRISNAYLGYHSTQNEQTKRNCFYRYQQYSMLKSYFIGRMKQEHGVIFTPRTPQIKTTLNV